MSEPNLCFFLFFKFLLLLLLLLRFALIEFWVTRLLVSPDSETLSSNKLSQMTEQLEETFASRRETIKHGRKADTKRAQDG